MERFESEIEQSVALRFIQSLIGTGLEVKQEDRWETPLLKRWFDIVIYKGSYACAVVEVKGRIENKNLLARATDQVRSAISITNSRFGIVTDGQQYYLYDRNKKDLDFVLVTFDQVISNLINPDKIKVAKKDRQSVLDIIVKSAEKNLGQNQEFLSFIRGKSFLNRIKFDSVLNTYFFSDNDGGITSFENQFFNKMFGEFKDTQICRYTSLKTIFDMLSYLSFRMNGLVGMNDKSEVNYVESYLNRGDGIVSFEKPLIKEELDTIISLNNRYITSCSHIDRKDDLTLWRLYADDAKGVCLVFNVNHKNLTKNVLLQKVKYADASGNHKELDFLSEIKAEVEKKTGFKFEFRNLGYWKHFFKPHDYAIEEEVRLLIIDNDDLVKLKTDWVMTYSHSIINPIIDFSLNSKSFPVQLKSILLGPKCPEQEINYVQIKELIRKKNVVTKTKGEGEQSQLKGVEVLLSSIKNYR